MPLPFIVALLVGWSALVGGLTTTFISQENNAFESKIVKLATKDNLEKESQVVTSEILPDFVIQAQTSRKRLESQVAPHSIQATTSEDISTASAGNTATEQFQNSSNDVNSKTISQPATIGSIAKKVLVIDPAKDTTPVASTKYSLIIMPDIFGTVVSSPTGIRCGFLCTYSYAKGTVVTLTATPVTGYTFAGWKGACTGTDVCKVTVNQITTVGAQYLNTAEPVAPKPDPIISGALRSSDVAAHSSASDCWIIVSGKVYSVGSYIALHPGGRSTITNVCGKDATDVFGSRGGTGSHSGSAWSLLGTFLVGNLSATEPVVPASSFTLSASVGGTGAGSIIASPDGINCSSACSASYAKGAVIKLTAIPSSGSTFSGWVGPCTGAGATCSVTMNQASTVSANFSMTQSQTQQAAGYTSSDVLTHASASDCWIIVADKIYSVGSYMSMHPGGRSVILNVCGQDATTVFNNRGGTGSHSGSAWSLLNTFLVSNLVTSSAPVPQTTNHTLSLSVTGAGTGLISSSPSGINCGQACSSSYTKGTTVTLTASPFSNSLFGGWTGACSGKSTCSVTLNQATSVGASFSVVSTTPVQTTFTTSEVANHATASDCWFHISGKVYSVGSYIAMHPGGSATILNQCGQDATIPFGNRGGTGSHSSSAWALLNSFLIGTISANTGTTPTVPPVTTTPTVAGYTVADIATHNTSTNCWIIVSGSVYSVGSYIAMHPGGRTAITNLCGKEATTPFSTRGGGSKHSTSAWNLLNTFLIGKVSTVTTPATPGTTPTTPTTSTTTTTTPTTPTTPTTTTYTAVRGVVAPSILQLYPTATIKKQEISGSGSQELEVNTTSGCRHIKVNSSGAITSNSKC